MKSEYGYTHKQIGQMTMRELVSSIKAIRKRKGVAMTFTAALHGHRLNLTAVEEKPQDEFTPEEDALMERTIREAQARKQAEMRGQRV